MLHDSYLYGFSVNNSFAHHIKLSERYLYAILQGALFDILSLKAWVPIQFHYMAKSAQKSEVSQKSERALLPRIFACTRNLFSVTSFQNTETTTTHR